MSNKITVSDPFKSTTCSICGKQYIRRPGNIYKVVFAGKAYPCCSYTCYQHANRIKESTNQSKFKRVQDEIKQKGEHVD